MVYFSSDVPSQGYIFNENPIKLAFWGKIIVCFQKIYLNKETFGLKFIKILQEWAHDQEILLFCPNFLLFLPKFSSAKGVRSKTGDAHPRQKFFRVTPPLPPIPTYPQPQPQPPPGDTSSPDITATISLPHLPLDEMAAISRTQHFQMYFHKWKALYYDSDFTEVGS